jgi:hypothetical protein
MSYFPRNPNNETLAEAGRNVLATGLPGDHEEDRDPKNGAAEPTDSSAGSSSGDRFDPRRLRLSQGPRANDGSAGK